MQRSLSILVTTAVLVPSAWGQAANTVPSPERFASSIKTFAEQDRVEAPPKESILFVGSSIFRLWKDLKTQMAPLPVFNRAFGGSRTADILYYMDQVVLPYAPKLIVYYCGSNDVNGGSEASTIAKGFFQFVERVHAKAPNTRILYVSILRAPQKMAHWDKVDEANRQVNEFCKRDSRLGFIDANPAVFDSANQPRMDLYLADKLHYKDPAYDGFTAIIRPVAEKVWRELQTQR